MLFSYYLDEDTLAAPTVKLSIENLFPCSKVESAFGDGNNRFTAHDLPFHMSVRIVLVGVVPISVQIFSRRTNHAKLSQTYHRFFGRQIL